MAVASHPSLFDVAVKDSIVVRNDLSWWRGGSVFRCHIGKTEHGTSEMAQYLNVKPIESVLRFPIIYLQNKSLLSVCHVSSIEWRATRDGIPCGTLIKNTQHLDYIVSGEHCINGTKAISHLDERYAICKRRR